MQIIHHLGAQSEQTSQLNLEEEERAEPSRPELLPSLLLLPADECSRSYNTSWRAMAISKYKAINDKAKTSHTAIVQRQHKKKDNVSEIKASSVGTLPPTIKNGA